MSEVRTRSQNASRGPAEISQHRLDGRRIGTAKVTKTRTEHFRCHEEGVPVIHQEIIAPPKPLSANEPSDVLRLQRTIDSLEKENAWLKEQLARMVRDK
jgi:hypothetical protein